MHRFFLTERDEIDFKHKQLNLKTPDTIKHLIKVLRISQNEKCEFVFDKRVFVASAKSISTDQITFTQINEIENIGESDIIVDLFQCLPKGQKMDLIIQKNVELGIHHIHLVASNRCVVDYKNKDIKNKLTRYQKIAQEAAKQSKAIQIPLVEGVYKLNELQHTLKAYDLVLTAYEGEKDNSLKSLSSRPLKPKKIAVIIGPEGGFERSEIDFLSECGSEIISLGERILRTETAGFVMVTLIQYIWGNL